jgi:hypothetical protein
MPKAGRGAAETLNRSEKNASDPKVTVFTIRTITDAHNIVFTPIDDRSSLQISVKLITEESDLRNAQES